MTDSEIFQTFSSCPVCNSKNIKLLYNTVDRHYSIKGEFSINSCASCKLAFLNPMPKQDYLTTLYPKTYYAYQDFFAKESKLVQFVKKYLVTVKTKDPNFTKPGSMLDIGCGSGNFIYKMREEKGWQVKGLEVNTDAANLGIQAGKLNIHCGELHTANYKENEFDYIRSNHSFEHVVDGAKLINEAYRILKPGGKFLIGVPNIDSINASFFKKYWWYLGVPVHTYNYTPKSLQLLLEQHNFIVEKINFNSDYSGILGSIQIYLNRKTNKVSTNGWLYNNPVLRIGFHYLAKLFDAFKQGDVIEIISTKK